MAAKPKRSEAEAAYVQHLCDLRRKSNTERNRAKYTRTVKHPKKGGVTMSNFQTTLAGKVGVTATGWRHTVAVTIGGETHTLTASEAATFALALQNEVAETFGVPQADSITSVRSANVRRTAPVDDSYIDAMMAAF